MRDIDEDWRLVRLTVGEIEEEEEEALGAAYGCDMDVVDVFGSNVGVTLDLMNGEKACLAAWSTRNLFKIWVSNRSPSWKNTMT